MQWSEVINNPLLQDLPFKIELNKFGNILMSPASNQHGRIQVQISINLNSKLPKGEVIAECSIQTADGVKVADVAWASNDFINKFSYKTPYPKAPEICVEIVSPSNSKEEIATKVNLYLAKGANEVWIVYENGRINTYTHTGEIKESSIAPTAQTIKKQ
ncbi:MAG: Uma2 family endonuclease [Methylococcales bacterium]